MRILLMAGLLSLSTSAFAQYEPPLGSRHAVAGPKTSMLTVGSTHLSAHSGTWSKQWLEPLQQRLVAWRPELVTVEQLSGSQCETLRGNPAVFGEVFEAYCRDATPFQRVLRMTQAQAAAEAAHQLAAWPAAPTPVQRRRLTMLFLAVPMTVLYLVSETIARLTDRRRARATPVELGDDELSPLDD